MNISRKEFFRKSIFSIGEALGTATGILKTAAAGEPEESEEPDFAPIDRPELVASAKDGHCLAASSGCFSCIEKCESTAISLVIGKGISIDPQSCTGCGTCEYICPVSPKAVALVARQQQN